MNYFSEISIEIAGEELLVLYDYVHLDKCMRTNLMKHDLFVVDENGVIRIIKWKVLILIFKNEKSRDGLVSVLSHLKEEYVYLKQCPLMRVKPVMKVFSNKTADMLNLIADSAGKLMNI